MAPIVEKQTRKARRQRQNSLNGTGLEEDELAELVFASKQHDAFEDEDCDSPASSPVNDPETYDTLVQMNRANRAKPKQEAPPCAFRPHPTRQDGLKDEIKHMLTKETAERKSQYQVCPRFNDYLSAIQVGSQVNVTHRRTIFEWNLKLADNDLRLSNQALHYTFTFFDRYLSRIEVPKVNLQLVSTACMWVASKICSSECPVAKAEQLEQLVGINKKEIKTMECYLLEALKWEVQPVTTFDMVHLLLPFMFCEHKYRAKLVQYVENITLAQALVYPLLKYPPSILAVAAVVCGAHLVVKQTNAKHKGMDEGLNAGLAELIGVDVAKTLECRKDVMQYINLDNLVLTNEQAQKVMADRAKKRQERLRRRKEGEFGAAGQPPNISAQQPTGPRQAL